MDSKNLRKDKALDHLAERVNVAQFVGFEPVDGSPKQTFSRICGDTPNTSYGDLTQAVERLLSTSSERSVNIRSYIPDDPKSKPFDYGLSSLDAIGNIVKNRIRDGLFVIVNETIDISDGGVSGVAEGGIIEFAPDDTPRCVEKPGTVSVPQDVAENLFRTVYGVEPNTGTDPSERLEFSIHPNPRGWRKTNTLAWEIDKTSNEIFEPHLTWPNRFSRLIGDKAFGLLVGHLMGVRVPYTTVFSRRIRPFSFGVETGTSAVWVRTCPREKVPGKYATVNKWIDPYALMEIEDPEPKELVDPDTGEVSVTNILSSSLAQMAVQAEYSGAAATSNFDEPTIEGIKGMGDVFMLGERPPEALPLIVKEKVGDLHGLLHKLIGPNSFEWVFDGVHVWLIQLHKGGVTQSGRTIVAGVPDSWRQFVVNDGLEALRQLLEELPTNIGVEVVGHMGLTSHLAEVLRSSGRPARFADIGTSN